MAATPEAKVKRMIDLALKREGVWFFPPQAGPYGGSGIPDRIGCLHGFFFAVEAKAGNNDLTSLQSLVRDQILAADGAYFVVRDVESLQPVLNWIENVRSLYASRAGEGSGPAKPDAGGGVPG